MKEWVLWHFHTLGSEELGYLGSQMICFYFQKCHLFCNKFVLKLKVVCVLLHVTTCILFIQWSFIAYFIGVEFHRRLFCRDKVLTRRTKEMKGTVNVYLHLPFPLRGGKHQYMKWHLNNLKRSVHKSRITWNRL